MTWRVKPELYEVWISKKIGGHRMPEIEEGNEPIIEMEDMIDATEYSIGFSIPDNGACLKFHNEFGVLSSFITDSQGIYDLAQRLLRAYDKLEGL